MNVQTRQQLSTFLQGELQGTDAVLGRLADPEVALESDFICVLRPKTLPDILKSKAATLVIAQDIAVQTDKTLIRVADIELAWIALLRLYAQPLEPANIDPSASIHSTAILEPNVHIGAFVVIGQDAHIGTGSRVGAHSIIAERSSIGNNSLIHERVTIRHDCHLGARVLIQSGAVIGADGFGFHRTANGYIRQEQISGVEIGSDTEIGANTVVDRGTLEPTRIGSGTKIGPNCVIAHNDQLGNNVILIGAVGLTGSVIIEDDAILWGQTGTIGHVRIGKGAVLTARSALSKDIPAGETWRGSPAQPIQQQLRLEARTRNIEKLEQRLLQLEQQLVGVTRQRDT